MKFCIVYDSKYGNGKTCVEYLKEAVSKKNHAVEVFRVDETESKSLPAADFYVFSTPTHVGGPTRRMKKFLKKLDVGEVRYSLMTTCRNTKNKTLEKMEKLLQPKGMVKASDGVKIMVTKLKGPLESDYRKKIDAFAKGIIG